MNVAGRRWTQQEDTYLRENWHKFSKEEIATALDRTIHSVRMRAVALRITTPKSPDWTEEEIFKLEESWGKCSIKSIAKSLGRSKNSVNVKAKRLGLGPSRYAAGKLTATQLAEALGVDRKAVTRWILKFGLKARKKVTREKARFWQISIDDFWAWAKDNQNKFDTRKFEPGTLGKEPPWMAVKRRTDYQLPPKRFVKWDKEEVNKLIALFKAGHLTYKQIGERLGRTGDSVERKLCRMRERKELCFGGAN